MFDCIRLETSAGSLYVQKVAILAVAPNDDGTPEKARVFINGNTLYVNEDMDRIKTLLNINDNYTDS